MTQLSFWGPDDQRSPKPKAGKVTTLRLLITVKAAPNPSARHGETVCVGALSVDPGRRSWIRLYPIHFRDLDDDNKFRKYDIVTVDALPANQDRRPESWKPHRRYRPARAPSQPRPRPARVPRSVRRGLDVPPHRADT